MSVVLHVCITRRRGERGDTGAVFQGEGVAAMETMVTTAVSCWDRIGRTFCDLQREISIAGKKHAHCDGVADTNGSIRSEVVIGDSSSTGMLRLGTRTNKRTHWRLTLTVLEPVGELYSPFVEMRDAANIVSGRRYLDKRQRTVLI